MATITFTIYDKYWPVPAQQAFQAEIDAYIAARPALSVTVTARALTLPTRIEFTMSGLTGGQVALAQTETIHERWVDRLNVRLGLSMGY